MTTERVFDAAAVEEYRRLLLELLEELEDEVIPVLREGALSRAPAFGSAPGAAEHALPRYLGFHAATWRNLQYLRGTLHGLAAALEAAAEEEAEGEAHTYWSFIGIGFGGEAG
jgi:hypothetical protein